MSTCPKCNRKLKFLDLSQYCPGCGVNLNYYGFEDKFYREAKEAELSLANVSKKVAYLKAAFVTSKTAIVRLCFCLLPTLALLAPIFNISLKLPFTDSKTGVNALGVFTMFSDKTLELIMSLASQSNDAAAFADVRNAVFAFAATAICAIGVLLCTLLSFISHKKTATGNCVLSVLGMVTATVSLIFAFIAGNKGGNTISVSASFGIAVVIACNAAVFVINLIIAKKGLTVEYNEGVIEKTEIRKKVLSGEIKIDDLPYPVVETEESRLIEEEIQKEKARLHGGEEG